MCSVVERLPGMWQGLGLISREGTGQEVGIERTKYLKRNLKKKILSWFSF